MPLWDACVRARVCLLCVRVCLFGCMCARDWGRRGLGVRRVAVGFGIDLRRDPQPVAWPAEPGQRPCTVHAATDFDCATCCNNTRTHTPLTPVHDAASALSLAATRAFAHLQPLPCHCSGAVCRSRPHRRPVPAEAPRAQRYGCVPGTVPRHHKKRPGSSCKS